ncbi:hypothetical protein CEXT_313451 [Caerostris extrusa]|uniref:Uncharacterized protein n=1 Tax=Caerostris extrusa TaxID=172846 RepID=A0AAV4W9B6_CAEEX|nr:hypothetical protein CEXT_313451 [Caerostris extrusa]
MSDTEKKVRFGDVTVLEFEVEPYPRRKLLYVCTMGEVVWQFVFFNLFSSLLTFLLLIEVRGEPNKLKEKHLWVYVLCIWPAIAIIVSAMYHKQQLLALLRRNTGEMELSVATELILFPVLRTILLCVGISFLFVTADSIASVYKKLVTMDNMNRAEEPLNQQEPSNWMHCSNKELFVHLGIAGAFSLYTILTFHDEIRPKKSEEKAGDVHFLMILPVFWIYTAFSFYLFHRIPHITERIRQLAERRRNIAVAYLRADERVII